MSFALPLSLCVKWPLEEICLPEERGCLSPDLGEGPLMLSHPLKDREVDGVAGGKTFFFLLLLLDQVVMC